MKKKLKEVSEEVFYDNVRNSLSVFLHFYHQSKHSCVKPFPYESSIGHKFRTINQKR